MEADSSGGKTSRGKVLCADDDESVLRVLGVLFGGNGYTPILARDGDQALVLFHQHKNELVAAVLDLRMPGKNGLELAKEIRKESVDLPLFALSANVGRGDLQDLPKLCAEVGFTGVTAKPFAVDPFLRMISEAVEKYAAGRRNG